MDRLIWIALAVSALLVLVLIINLRRGRIHSSYDYVDRRANPGGYWALFMVLLLPLIACLLLVLTLLRHHH
jgi:hypothetical protein